MTIRKHDPRDEVIEALQHQQVVTETLLLKVLEKTGPVTLTAEELSAEVNENLMIDMDLDEATDVWTFSLKEETPEG